MSVAQSFGTWIPASMEARMIDVPSGTVISRPSMVSVTNFSEREAGVRVDRVGIGHPGSTSPVTGM